MGNFVAIGQNNAFDQTAEVSVDDGANWSLVPMPFDPGSSGNNVCVASGKVLVLSSDGKVAISSNDGVSFTLNEDLFSDLGLPSPFGLFAADDVGLAIVGALDVGGSVAIGTFAAGTFGWAVGGALPADMASAGGDYSPPLDRMVLVGQTAGGSDTVAYSDDHGATWVGAGDPTGGGYLTRVLWLPEVSTWIACGNDGVAGSNVFTSADGITWSGVAALDTEASALGWNGTRLVLQTDAGVYYSDDLSTFIPGTSDLISGYEIAYGDGVWVAAGYDGSGDVVAVSTDNGLTWDAVASPLSDGFGSTANGVVFVSAAPLPASVRFLISPPWRFLVTDRDSGTLTFLDRLAMGRHIEFPLDDGPASASCRVPSESPEVNIIANDDDPFVETGDRLLYCFRRDSALGEDLPWTVRFAGILEQLQDAGDTERALTTLTAYDPWKYLYARPVVLADGSLPGPQGLVFSGGPSSPGGVSATLIAAVLLADSIANQGPTGIDAGVTYQGTAFWGGHIVVPGGANPPDGVNITFQNGTTIGEAWQQLVDTGAIEIVLTPIYDPINRGGYLCDLSIWPQVGDTQYGAVFSWDMPSRSLTAINRLRDAAQLANNIDYFAGRGGSAVTSGGVPAHPTARNAASVTKYGEYWATRAWPDANATDQASITGLRAAAAAELAVRKDGRLTVEFTPAPERAPQPWIDYWLGDRVPVYASRRLRRPIP